MRSVYTGLAVVLACAAFGAAPASASANLGFENGDLSGWTTNGGPAAAVTGYGAFAPAAGQYLGAIEAGLGVNSYTTLSRSFSLTAGGTISGYAGFQANDYVPYNDDAYLAINGLTLLAWNVASVGDYAASGWNGFSFTAATAGVYTLELGVANRADNGYSSGAVLDAVHVTGEAAGAVPEAATWAMMVVGFGFAGSSLRSRRSAVSFG